MSHDVPEERNALQKGAHMIYGGGLIATILVIILILWLLGVV